MNYPETKLPKVGTTIFTQMSQLAAQHNALDLSQGFPDFDGPTALLDAVGQHISSGANQYAPMAGVPALREAIAEKVSRFYGGHYCAEREITITSGATEALFAAISAVVRTGDEVIMFDPAYDSYEPAVEINGGTTVRLQLSAPHFKVDWQAVRDAITAKTRLIILNSPHNPTGATLTQHDLDTLADMLADTDILVLSDEVYEHIVFDGEQHQSVAGHEALRERSFVVSSFGKTYHITGWKVGYCLAPAALSAELRKVHQYLTFAISTPMQLAIADYMADAPNYGFELPAFYQQKRDLFCRLMASSRFELLPTQGTYFQLVDYRAIKDVPDIEFCQWLIEHAGVVAIPISVFYQTPPDTRIVRFCFAKGEATLKAAAERLVNL